MRTYHVRKIRNTGDTNHNYSPLPMADSPVEVALKAGPRGNGDWPGYGDVWSKISAAAQKMALTKSYLSDAHIDTMADLGSGHEERMKARLRWLREYGWI